MNTGRNNVKNPICVENLLSFIIEVIARDKHITASPKKKAARKNSGALLLSGISGMLGIVMHIAVYMQFTDCTNR